MILFAKPGAESTEPHNEQIKLLWQDCAYVTGINHLHYWCKELLGNRAQYINNIDF
jgi:hypothetical protein